MKRLTYPLLVWCLLGGSGWAISQPKNAARPNIIFIMVDDLGYGDLSCYGRKDYQTPALDALVGQGMNFKQAYAAAPVCTPTRVGFLTGRYPARIAVGLREPLTGLPMDQPEGLAAGQVTVSSLLKAAGYHTQLIGKWHLGRQPDHHPNQHGFEEFYGIMDGAADYISHQPGLYHNADLVQQDGYMTDLFTQRATAFLNQAHAKPFFLSLQYTAPHWPWQGPTDPPYPDSLNWRDGGSEATYEQMMQRLDEGIGQVLTTLQQQGLAENTLVIFTSDNGGERYSSMGPFKGKKMTLWEGGIRVPAAVRWPGVVKPGSVSQQPVITMDWSVTILAAAGVSYPKNWDGINLLPHLQEKAPLQPRTFYWRTANRVKANAFRQGDWKYLHTPEGEYLFNLARDPYEATDLKAERPEQFARIKSAFAEWNQQMLPPLVLAPSAKK